MFGDAHVPFDVQGRSQCRACCQTIAFVIMVMREHEMARDLYDRFLLLITDDGHRERIITYEDVERLLGTAFAINGITEKSWKCRPGCPGYWALPIAIIRSRAFTRSAKSV